MKITFFIIPVLALALVFTGCSKVPAGHVGIKVYLLGKEKGVDSETLGTGQYWIGINEELYIYPTYVQQYTFTQGNDGDSPNDEAFYFQNREGVKCNLDLSIQAYADATKVAILFQKFRDDLRDVMHINLRNFIRDRIQYYAASLSTEDLYSTKKMEMIRMVERDLKNFVEPLGIIIVGISLLSDIRFPPEVEASIVAKIKATQEALQRENEIQKAKADAEIKITQAKAEAEAIRLKQSVINQALIQYEATQKWDGRLPTYMGGNAVPFINIPQK
jgi:regulator of protease activity HflC (stomatin/prohibitin superfamily)